MPATDGRHHLTTHRTCRSTLGAGAALIITLTAAACTTNTSPPAPATTAAAASGPAPTLTGAGSTFDAPFFDLAFAKYHQLHPAVTVGYCRGGEQRGHRRHIRRSGRFRRF